MQKLTPKQIKIYKKFKTPWAIQGFLNTIPINFERKRETCYSPKTVLEKNTAHCMEGAMLAASMLRFHGYPPLVLDLRARRPDFDHVVTLFKIKGYFGAISKTNHAVLRYRDPIYKTLRELALSYFHEYFLDNGTKTMVDYSKPFNLSQFDHIDWEQTDKELWDIPEALDEIQHKKILLPWQRKILKKADLLERKAGQLTDWKN